MAQGILSGIQVIDMATYIFGPVRTRVMSDFGAEVIKIESPGIRDPYRYAHNLPPFPPSELDYMFQHDNRNKRGMVLDMKVDAGHEVLLALIRTTAVFVTNFPCAHFSFFTCATSLYSPHCSPVACTRMRRRASGF